MKKSYELVFKINELELNDEDSIVSRKEITPLHCKSFHFTNNYIINDEKLDMALKSVKIFFKDNVYDIEEFKRQKKEHKSHDVN